MSDGMYVDPVGLERQFVTCGIWLQLAAWLIVTLIFLGMTLPI